MASIIYYGKPNCINNKKQKLMLKTAGHQVDDRDILSTSWTPEELREFFGDTPVPEWFNITAPAIKSRSFLIDTLSEQQALAAMVQDPLLIRRPLMEIEGNKTCGFRFNELDQMIGMAPVAGQQVQMQTLRNENITTCPFTNQETNCDKQEQL